MKLIVQYHRCVICQINALFFTRMLSMFYILADIKILETDNGLKNKEVGSRRQSCCITLASDFIKLENTN